LSLAILLFVGSVIAQDPCQDFAPDTFTAIFSTTQGNFSIAVTRDWAVNSADRFWSALGCGHYNGDEFFWFDQGKYVVWGLSGVPSEDASWSPLVSDVMVQKNKQGYVSFYAPNGIDTGSTEIVVNLVDNPQFDTAIMAPFGVVSIQDLQIIEKLYSGYGTQPDESMIKEQGNTYLQSNFPLLDKTKTTTATVHCAAGTKECNYEPGNPFAVECCTAGESCLAGVGCRCFGAPECVNKSKRRTHGVSFVGYTSSNKGRH